MCERERERERERGGERERATKIEREEQVSELPSEKAEKVKRCHGSGSEKANGG